MYGKIFESMYEGTLYGHWQAIVTFQQMIVFSGPDGVVDMTPQAIAARTSIPLEIIHAGIRILEEPDPYSRSPEEEGRRIVLLDPPRPWGWRIVNHAYYRDLASREDKRRADRERIAGKRATSRDMSQGVAGGRGESPGVENVADVADADADADASADTDTSKNPPTPQGGKSAAPTGGDPSLAVNRIFDHWRKVHEHPKAQLDKKRRALINAALKNYDEQTLKDSISGYRYSPHHKGINERNTAYDTIELMLKDAKHIDMGLQFHAKPPKGAGAQQQLSPAEAAWKKVREDAAAEGFRSPHEGETFQDYRAALQAHTNAKGREHLAKLQAMAAHATKKLM